MELFEEVGTVDTDGGEFRVKVPEVSGGLLVRNLLQPRDEGNLWVSDGITDTACMVRLGSSSDENPILSVVNSLEIWYLAGDAIAIKEVKEENPGTVEYHHSNTDVLPCDQMSMANHILAALLVNMRLRSSPGKTEPIPCREMHNNRSFLDRMLGVVNNWSDGNNWMIASERLESAMKAVMLSRTILEDLNNTRSDQVDGVYIDGVKQQLREAVTGSRITIKQHSIKGGTTRRDEFIDNYSTADSELDNLL